MTNIILFFVSIFALSGCLTTRSQLKEQSKLQTEVATLQVNKAEVEARSQEFESQLRDYNGRIENLETSVAELKQLNVKNEEKRTVDAELLENKFKLIQDALLKIEEELQNVNNEIAKLKSQKKTAAVAAPAPTKGNYSQAEIDFSNKKWKQAAVGYQKYRDLNPNGRRYSDATYKIGVCFQEMGMKSEAKAFYEEVIEKYPKSREAGKATYRLKNL